MYIFICIYTYKCTGACTPLAAPSCQPLGVNCALCQPHHPGPEKGGRFLMSEVPLYPVRVKGLRQPHHPASRWGLIRLLVLGVAL